MASTADLVSESVNEDKVNEKDAFKNLSFQDKFIYIKNAITVEPVICFYLVAIAFCVPAIRILPLEMACRVNAKFNSTICDSIITGTFREQGFEDQMNVVQQYVSDMMSWCNPVEKVVPVILLLFLGSYSDEYKIRKPFLLMPIFGEFFSAAACMICVLYKDSWPVEVEGIAQLVIPSFFGGPSLLVMAAFAYIIDISTPDMLVIKMAALQIAINICLPIALAVSAVFFDATGSIACLVLGLCLFITAFVYGCFVVKEPKKMKKVGLNTLIKDAFNPKHAIETFKLFTKSTGAARWNIVFILTITYITATVNTGEGNIFFLFTVAAYDWTNVTETYYQAVAQIVNLIGLGIGVPILSKVLHISDLIIIVVGYFDKILSNIVCITVKSTCGLYMGLVAGIVSGVSGVATRSQSSKYVSEDDMGKAQSLLSITEAVAGVVAVEIYHQGIWRHRQKSLYAFYYLGTGIFAVGIVLVIWKYFKERNVPNEKVATNGTELQTTHI